VLIEVTCPNCASVMAVFDEQEMAANKAIRRAYKHMVRDPVLCGCCKSWVQRPHTSRPHDVTEKSSPEEEGLARGEE